LLIDRSYARKLTFELAGQPPLIDILYSVALTGSPRLTTLAQNVLQRLARFLNGNLGLIREEYRLQEDIHWFLIELPGALSVLEDIETGRVVLT